MNASLPIAAAAAIVGLLGVIHVVITFTGTKLLPRDDTLADAMRAAHPRLTRQTTMWRAWIGFNASHGFGAMLFAATWGYLALAQPAWLFGSPFLLALGQAFLLGYVWLGWRYWFSVPFRGIVAACALYALGVALSV